MLRTISPLLTAAELVVLFFVQAAALSQAPAAEQTTSQPPSSSQAGGLALSGDRLVIWSEPDGTRILLYWGDFRAQGSGRVLTSQKAVIWLRQTRKNSQVQSSLSLYLEGDVRLVEPSQTVTEDQTLLTELTVSGRLTVQAAERTSTAQRDDPLYLQAIQALQRSRAAEPIETYQPPEKRGQKTDVQPPQTAVDQTDQKRQPDVIKTGPLKFSPGPIFMRGSLTVLQRDDEIITTLQADDRGQVYVSQGARKAKLLLEMQADAAVIFQDTTMLEKSKQPEGRSSEQLGRSFTGVYLEGHVLLRQGERTIRAKKVYYDFRRQRALILDGVLRTVERQRKVPIYLRAREIRQLSQGEFLAKKATLTSSDFYRPDYHIGASKVLIKDSTARDAQGESTGPQKLHLRADNITFNVGGLPLFWWPRVTGDFKRGETPLHTVKFGNSKTDGFAVETEWLLYRLLGLEEPDNVDAILGLDYMTRRGPVLRYEIDYLRDQYEGYSRGYFIDDHGQDRLSRTRKDLEPPRETRGRFLLRHRHYLPRGWELELEASYISDANWLEQFEENEFDTGKDQETAIYLKKQVDNWAFSMLANSRLMDFINLTEHLPEGRFVLIGQPLLGSATGFLDVRTGIVRLRANDEFGPPMPIESSSVLRGDLRAEIELPLQLGGVKIVPYVSARETAWDDSVADGGQNRHFFSAGLRAATQFWRIYDKVQSRVLDLYQLRHIIQPQVHIFGAAGNWEHGQLGTKYWPFDQEVEGIHEFAAVSVALLQTWQTKRGLPQDLRTVDWLNLNLRTTFFNRQDAYFGPDDFSDSAWPTNMARVISRGRWFDYRPENSFPRDNIEADLSLRLSDTTLLFADANYGMKPRGFDRVNVGLAVTRSPRLSYFVADRYDSALDMQVLTAGATYKINEKYTLAGAHQMDIDNGNGLETGISLVRKFPRWYLALTADIDRGRDNSTIMLTVWTEGAPEVRVGSRPVGRIAAGR